MIVPHKIAQLIPQFAHKMAQLSVETCGGGGRVSTIYMDHFTRL